ncbi:MAG TPA: IS66 family transposase, partial [Pseudobdellovibrionaceae bacterium]|nr:IS66 family transposase [Pseudobdellovibrionaceae bacterium]
PLSKGSISNFNKMAFDKLDYFEEWAKLQLFISPSINADETGINVGGGRHWLHCLSTPLITLFHPDKNRGTEAMERMGVLSDYDGIVTHDHWKPYFKFLNCIHSLCNAHHLRELEWAFENEGQKWAKQMQKLLLEIKVATENAGGCLSKKPAIKFRKKYRRLLSRAQRECPVNSKSRAQSKSRNLLERLIEFENETLLFMENLNVSFTNNIAENDQRMTKVQQKISGCFRSMEGAKIFCRIRSYLITCRKNGVGATEALLLLFEGQLPAFMI